MRKVTKKIKYFSSKVFKCNLTCQRCSWRKSERSSAKQRPSSSLAPQTAPKLCCWTWQFQEKMERKASPQGKLVAGTWGRLSCKSLWYFRHQRMKQKRSQQQQQQQHRSSDPTLMHLQNQSGTEKHVINLQNVPEHLFLPVTSTTY